MFVTHDQIEAMSMGDKVGVLNHGRLVQVGTPQEIYTIRATPSSPASSARRR
jgi:multiple sugar transport system ATP-binding protein